MRAYGGLGPTDSLARHLDFGNTGEPVLFKADCGHEWVATAEGTYACPTCGRYDGDHHLISMDPIVVVGASNLPIRW